MSYLRISSLILVLLFLGCSKEYRSTKKLEGTWQLVKKETNGAEVNIDGLSVIMNFDLCYAATNNCRGTYHEKVALPDNSSTTKILPIHSEFSKKGKFVTFEYNYGAFYEFYEVIELTRKSMVIQYVDSENVYYFEALE